MRIGVLHQYALDSSGSGMYAIRLVDELLQRGHHVALISRDRDPGRLPFVGEVTDAADLVGIRPATDPSCRAYRLRHRPAAVSYPRAEEPGTPTFAQLSNGDLERWLTYHIETISKIAALEELEVLHANHEVPMAYVAACVARRVGIPYVVLGHGSTLEYVHAADPRYHELTIAGLRGAATVIALTRELRDRVVAICPDVAPNISIIGAGVNPDVFCPAPTPLDAADEPVIAYAGRLSLEKGVHALLAAFPQIVSRAPGTSLRIIGDGVGARGLREMMLLLGSGDLEGAEEQLRELARPAGEERWLAPVLEYWHSARRDDLRREAVAAGLHERVTFTGRLDAVELAANLRSARLVAVPSLIKEAFPLITVEALACGVPFVAADHGGLTAVLDDVAPALGLLGPRIRVAPGSDRFVDALAVAAIDVLHVLKEPVHRATSSAECRAFAVERYSWARVAGRVERAYSDAVSACQIAQELA